MDQQIGLVLVILSDNNYAPPKYEPVPLKSVSVKASVVHAVGQVEITQVYVNKEEQPVEAVYLFPIDSNGAVVHFHAELEDGRVIKGVVKPNEVAKKEYEEAISNRQTAFLGEENKPDIFKLSVGFLHPGATVRVVIGYVTEVKNDPDSHAVRFFLPTTVAPRYVPLSSHLDKDPAERGKAADLANMTFSTSSPAPLDITVIVSVKGALRSVECLSKHGVTVSEGGVIEGKPAWTKSVVTLNGSVTDMDRDFVLVITPEEPTIPRLFSERSEDDGSTALMLHLIPSFKLKDQNVELVVLLDRSGSMGGHSIDLAKQALQLLLHSIPTNCCFNIIGFGSGYEVLFPEGSEAYSKKSLNTAMTHVKRVDANLGGTEIMTPIRFVYSKKPMKGYTRQMIIITDGEVGNTEEVIGIVKQNAGNTRVFALGIGSSASHHLVDGIAKAGKGTSAFVGSNTDIHKATMAQLKNALQPTLTDVEVDWGETRNAKAPSSVPGNTEKTLFGYNKPIHDGDKASSSDKTKAQFWQSPNEIPPIFDGHQLVAFALFEEGCVLPETVKMTAISPDGPLTLEMKLSEDSDLGDTKMLHRLAVVGRIREMEMEELGSNFRKQEITDISVAHGVMSKYTSFIAVDEKRGDENEGEMVSRVVPSQIAAGWGGGFHIDRLDLYESCVGYSLANQSCARRCHAVNYCLMESSYEQLQSSRFESRGKTTKGGSRTKLRSVRSLVQGVGNFFANKKMAILARTDSNFVGCMEKSVGAPQWKGSEEDQLVELINMQEFEGMFPLNEAVIAFMGVDFTSVKKAQALNGWDENGWATCLVITFLREKRAQFTDYWDLVVKKAEKW